MRYQSASYSQAVPSRKPGETFDWSANSLFARGGTGKSKKAQNDTAMRNKNNFFSKKWLRNEEFLLIPWCLRQKVVSLQQSLNIGGYTMIEIKETLVIKSDSPKVAEWVKRMKAYKAAQLQDMAKRGCEVCEIAM